NARVKGQFNVNYCQELVRVVTSAGSNKAYAGRLSPGSGFVLRDDASVFNDSADYKYREPFDYRDFVNAAIDGEPYQSSDYLPFGSLVQPADSQYPTAWDSKSGSLYRQPLLYEPPRPSFGPPHQARMGELHKAEKIQQLFARSYGVWEWEWDQDRCSGGSKHNQTCSEDSDCPVTFIEGLANGVRQVLGFPPTEHQCIPATGEGGGYTLADPLNNWDLISQDEYCTGDTRPDDQLCKIRPKITNIAVNGQLSEDIIGSGTARLSFNITVDPDQAPITAYTIVWGDGTADTISGVILRSRVNPENPFIVNHLYDYGQMYRSDNQDGVLQNCDENQCTAKVTISTTDNWGASNSATMTGTITVFRD
ncbi:hypothetical protein HYZ76_00255, partial [Candidatus Falkowbacteria bacterium]|nr:hypothetical protein [Candidatus Falkowbacteria bacterium]